MAQTVQEILAAAKKAGASDVHITVGIPPKMRVNGKLITMEGERLLPSDTMEIANSVMNDTQKQRFEDKGEVDMSFAIAGETVRKPLRGDNRILNVGLSPKQS